MEQIDLPVSYVHGADSGMFEKIEINLEGHRTGDSVSVTLAPEEGFGHPSSELTFTDDINNVPEQFRYIGTEVAFQNERGESKVFRVSKNQDGKLTVDGNHPLAGKTLTFILKILAIRNAKEDEIQLGRMPGDSLMY